MSNRTRGRQIKFFVSDEERNAIEQRIKLSGAISDSHFLRQMALQGHIIHVQIPEISKLLVLLSNAASNLNQIARRVNTDSLLFAEDIETLQRDYNQLNAMVNTILGSLRTGGELPKPQTRLNIHKHRINQQG